MAIRTCPSCGNRRLRRQAVTLTAAIRNKKATITGLEIEVCPDCGEKLFDLEASRRMEERFLPKRRKHPVSAA
jgi:YgiT-type zinc finger domain-containing protein